MQLGLAGKVVLITGASRGIGAACARALAAQGASVVINCLASRDKADALLAEIVAAGGQGMVAQADVRKRAAVELMVQSALERFGRIDVLVNNANIHFPIKPFVQFAWDEIRQKVEGELESFYNCSQAVLGGMLERRSGKLILISSSLSRWPGHGFSAHAAAKAALDSLGRVMALELGPQGIAVNVVAPGLTRTDATAFLPQTVHGQTAALTPLRRVGLPDDVAGAVVYLASDLSGFITGQYFPVNGGISML